MQGCPDILFFSTSKIVSPAIVFVTHPFPNIFQTLNSKEYREQALYRAS